MMIDISSQRPVGRGGGEEKIMARDKESVRQINIFSAHGCTLSVLPRQYFGHIFSWHYVGHEISKIMSRGHYVWRKVLGKQTFSETSLTFVRASARVMRKKG